MAEIHLLAQLQVQLLIAPVEVGGMEEEAQVAWLSPAAAPSGWTPDWANKWQQKP